MKRLAYPLFGVILLLSIEACQDRRAKNYNQETKVDQDGLEFLQNGVEGGNTEIKASGIAITNSRNMRIINFAKMMVDDHTQANDDLKKIEKDKLVNAGDTINTDHHQKLVALAKLNGPAFDKAYIQMMLNDHNDAIKLFTSASQNTDIEVRDFAAKTLPKLKMHLDSATAISASLK
jgi:putative membrane protein